MRLCYLLNLIFILLHALIFLLSLLANYPRDCANSSEREPRGGMEMGVTEAE